MVNCDVHHVGENKLQIKAHSLHWRAIQLLYSLSSFVFWKARLGSFLMGLPWPCHLTMLHSVLVHCDYSTWRLLEDSWNVASQIVDGLPTKMDVLLSVSALWFLDSKRGRRSRTTSKKRKHLTLYYINRHSHPISSWNIACRHGEFSKKSSIFAPSLFRIPKFNFRIALALGAFPFFQGHSDPGPLIKTSSIMPQNWQEIGSGKLKNSSLGIIFWWPS